ncbi:Uracil catabolism protein [Lachnellula suecica]|uniref:Uracil catabolism protein n=1 Tax=Lachnellula suecica TaxID=602035 RepID=A0A8T9BUX2_9HELO|nr:Uracil catabolism protein [Lachnellula suecica]
MGIFSRKDKSGSATSGSTRKNSSNLGDIQSMSSQSQSSLRSPITPGYNKMSIPPTIPKITLPKAPDPHVDPAGYLRSIGAVRERCTVMLGKAKQNKLNHFDVDMSMFEHTTKFVVAIIKRDFAPDYASIPPHGRWQHFNVGGRDRIAELLNSWANTTDQPERCRRLLDLFLVSVLLDAGAGTSWSYYSAEEDRKYKRSEGLAIASLEMFKSGAFSSDKSQPHQVDSEGLQNLTVGIMSAGLQVSDKNPIAGLEGRTNLLIRLSQALKNHTFFGADGRPGNMIDYLLSHATTQASSIPIVMLPTLWTLLTDGLAPIWPSSRTAIDSTPLGDAWPLSSMPTSPTTQPWETIVPFHKLTQWLCYSLMQPMSKLMHMHFIGAELMTGLPEYRNGGLFIDTGVLTLKPQQEKRGIQQFLANSQNEKKEAMEVVPMFAPDDDVIVEWRAVTVGFLDLLLEDVNERLGLQGVERLSLPQMLEAGSWKGGREVAEISRPNTQCPPIAILSDGTVF